MEQRDLWEYRTNLTEAEVRRMTLHILEMQGIYTDYYFLDENCSYDLLFLLEAARPSVYANRPAQGILRRADRYAAQRAGGGTDRQRRLPPIDRPERSGTRPPRPEIGEVDLAKALASGDVAPSAVADGTPPAEGRGAGAGPCVRLHAVPLPEKRDSQGHLSGSLSRYPLRPEQGRRPVPRIQPRSRARSPGVRAPRVARIADRRGKGRSPVSRGRIPSRVPFAGRPLGRVQRRFPDRLLGDGGPLVPEGRPGPSAAMGPDRHRFPLPEGRIVPSRIVEGQDGVRNPGLPRRRGKTRVRTEPWRRVRLESLLPGDRLLSRGDRSRGVGPLRPLVHVRDGGLRGDRPAGFRQVGGACAGPLRLWSTGRHGTRQEIHRLVVICRSASPETGPSSWKGTTRMARRFMWARSGSHGTPTSDRQAPGRSAPGGRFSTSFRLSSPQCRGVARRSCRSTRGGW